MDPPPNYNNQNLVACLMTSESVIFKFSETQINTHYITSSIVVQVIIEIVGYFCKIQSLPNAVYSS
jgi:hypothetical protein